MATPDHEVLVILNTTKSKFSFFYIQSYNKNTSQAMNSLTVSRKCQKFKLVNIFGFLNNVSAYRDYTLYIQNRYSTGRNHSTTMTVDMSLLPYPVIIKTILLNLSFYIIASLTVVIIPFQLSIT